MDKQALAKKRLPEAPGVYFFLGPRKEILYIGKATNLKSRVRSYFAHDIKEKRSELIEKMVNEARSLDWTVTDSVLESLILESNLIRTHKPKYNTISKDDKSYNHLIITNEEYPRVLVVRGKDLTSQYSEEDIKYHFGPFTSGTMFKEALQIVRRIFKFYDTKKPIKSEVGKFARGKIDFNRQIGLYPDSLSKKEYARTIRHLQLFFEGKKKQILAELTKEMNQYAKQEQFEKANEIKKKLFALTHIQDIALLKVEKKAYRDDRSVRVEAYDVAHHGGDDMVGVMTVIERGEVMKGAYRKFKIKTLSKSNDTAALKEMLHRRLTHTEWPLPQIVVVDGATAQKRAAESMLRKHNITIPVVAVVKDDRHRPKRLIGTPKLLSQFQNDILLANAEAHRFAIAFHRSKSRKRKLS